MDLQPEIRISFADWEAWDLRPIRREVTATGGHTGVDDDFLIEDVDEDIDEDEDEEDDGPAYLNEPCARCERTHVAVFFGERYNTFEVQAPIPGLRHSLIGQSSTRLGIRTCMDCGYVEIYQETLLPPSD